MIRKVVIRQMSLYLATIDIPIYGALVLTGLIEHKELVLVLITTGAKLLLVYLEYKAARKKLDC